VPDKQPASTVALATPVRALVTCTRARWAFSPIIFQRAALHGSITSFRANPAPTLLVGSLYGIARCSAESATRNWQRALHVIATTILSHRIGRGPGLRLPQRHQERAEMGGLGALLRPKSLQRDDEPARRLYRLGREDPRQA
jgi:hypothetical protein